MNKKVFAQPTRGALSQIICVKAENPDEPICYKNKEAFQNQREFKVITAAFLKRKHGRQKIWSTDGQFDGQQIWGVEKIPVPDSRNDENLPPPTWPSGNSLTQLLRRMIRFLSYFFKDLPFWKRTTAPFPGQAGIIHPACFQVSSKRLADANTAT